MSASVSDFLCAKCKNAKPTSWVKSETNVPYPRLRDDTARRSCFGMYLGVMYGVGTEVPHVRDRSSLLSKSSSTEYLHRSLPVPRQGREGEAASRRRAFPCPKVPYLTYPARSSAASRLSALVRPPVRASGFFALASCRLCCVVWGETEGGRERQRRTDGLAGGKAPLSV